MYMKCTRFEKRYTPRPVHASYTKPPFGVPTPEGVHPPPILWQSFTLRYTARTPNIAFVYGACTTFQNAYASHTCACLYVIKFLQPKSGQLLVQRVHRYTPSTPNTAFVYWTCTGRGVYRFSKRVHFACMCMSMVHAVTSEIVCVISWRASPGLNKFSGMVTSSIHSQTSSARSSARSDSSSTRPPNVSAES